MQDFRPFAAQVRKNVESVLRDYEIDDAATKRGPLATLVALDVLEGHDDAARGRLDEIKALEEKPAAKALSGLMTRSILDARRESGDRLPTAMPSMPRSRTLSTVCPSMSCRTI